MKHASMNRIYRLIWNAALGVWVAVAENAKGKGKGGSSRRSVLALAAVLAAIHPSSQAADAANAAVTAGIGSVSSTGLTTTINQASQRMAIDWTKLSTAANESLVFKQPGASSIALNRVTGTDPSQLLGSLSANGQVFVLNPNGVMFGATSQVNVGGLVASTLGLSNDDFMNGKFSFTNASGRGVVANQGTMTAAPGGYLALLAPEARNEGVMTANLGSVLLAAGNKVTVNLDNGSLLGYSIDQGAINSLAENRHLIKADGGQVLLSAQALDALTTATVNNTGVIEARTVGDRAGRIMLMGDMKSGTVKVGGTLDASAPNGGDGGFIETSARHVRPDETTWVTAHASYGRDGTWLIDPERIFVTPGANPPTPIGNDEFWGNAFINGVLAGTNLILQTNAGSGVIQVQAPLNWTGNTLTLIGSGTGPTISIDAPITFSTGNLVLFNRSSPAPGPIIINAAITSTSGTLTARTNNYIAINSPINLGSGYLALHAGTSITVNADVTAKLLDIENGAWRQVSSTLPALNVTDFRLASASTFIRATGGDGSDANPYRLVDIFGVQGSGHFGGAHNSFVLLNDIDATNTANWRDSQGFEPMFLGGSSKFDGAYHVISNLTIKPASGNAGFFRTISSGSGVMRLGLLNVIATGQDFAGGMAARNDGDIIQSYVTGQVKTTSPASEFSEAGAVGGLAGTNTGYIENSYSTASVTAVAPIANAGAGGLVGEMTGGDIINSYSSGTVTSPSFKGGLVGRVSAGDSTDNFWNVTTSGQATSAMGLGRTNAEMMQASTMLNWDITTTGGSSKIWRIYEGHTAPLLRGFLRTPSMPGSSPTYNGAEQTHTLSGANWYGTGARGTNVGVYAPDYWSDQQGYDFGSGGNLTILPKAIDLTGTRAYNGTIVFNATDLSLSNLVIGETLTLSGSASASSKNVGTRNLNISGLTIANGTGLASNYVLGSKDVTITQAVMSLTGTRAYNGTTTFNSTGLSLNNLVAGETLTLSGSASASSKNVGTRNLNISGLTIANGTGLASNYVLGSKDVTITQAALVLGANDVTKVYDGGTTVTGGSAKVVSGTIFSGDTLTGGSFAFTNKNAGIGNKTVTTAGVTVNDGIGGGNYAVSYANTTTSTINKASATVTANNSVLNYNGATQSVTGFTASGLVSGETISVLTGVSTSGGSGRHAGSYALTAGGTDTNYNLNFVAGGLNITPKLVTLNAPVISKTYDGTTLYSASASDLNALSGQLVGGDSVTGITLGYTTKNASTGSKVVNISGATISDSNGGGNYTVNYAGNSISTINKANLILSTSDVIKTYDGNTSAAGLLQSTGLVSGDSLSGGAFAFANKNASIGDKIVTTSGVTVNDGNSGNNYTVFYAVNTTSTINKASATVTANSSVLTYNAATQSVSGFSATGLVGGESAAVLTGVSTSGGSGRNVGSYALAASGTDSNYNFSFVPGGLDITAKAVTLNAPVITKTYDGSLSYSATPSDLSVLSSQLLGTDSVTAIALAYANKNAGIGNKLVTIGGAAIADGNSGSNYSVGYAGNTTSTINKANATVNANSSVLTYNAATQSISGFTASGLVGGETSSVLTGVSTTGGSGRNVGNYALTASGSDSNYNLSFVPGGLDITAKAVTLNAPVITKVYDGGLSYSATPSDLSALSTQLLGTDSVTAIALAYADKNAGIGNKLVTIGGAAISDGNSGNNYSVSYAGNSASTINKANATVTANSSVLTYNAATQSVSGFTASGLVGGETSSVLTGVSTTGGSGRNVGNYALTASGTDSNYNLSFVPGGLDITAKAVTLNAPAITKTYDGGLSYSVTPADLSALTSQLLGGDSVAGISLAFADKNAGLGNKAVNVSGAAIADGNSGNNYSVSYAGNSASTINKAAATVTANSSVLTYNAATQSVNGFTASGLVGGETSSVLSGVSTTGGSGRNVGSYTITASGTDSNYNLSFVSGGLDITAKAVTLNAPVITKTYDGGLSYSATSSDLGALGGQLLPGDSVTAISLAYSDKNASIGNKVVNVSGAAIADGNSGKNYNVSYAGNSVSTINKTDATVTANSSVLTYNAATQSASGFTASGLVGGETSSVLTGVSTTGGSGRNVGSYAITASGTDSNYKLSFVPGGLDITAKAITLNAPVITKVYDGGLSYSATPPDLSALSSQLLDGDSVTAITLAYADKNAGIGNKLVSIGSAAISDGNNGNNYSVIFAGNNTSTINKANATVTANSSVLTYNAATQLITGYSATGLVGGESVAVLTGVSTTGGSGRNVGSYALTASGTDNNYNLSFVPGGLDITAKAVTLNAPVITKTYDGGLSYSATPSDLNALSSQLLAGDSVTAIALAYADKNAGIGNKLVNIGGAAISDGNSGNNYSVSYAGNSVSTINRANATVTANSSVLTYNAATQSASGFTATGLVGGETAAVLSGVSTTGGSGRNVGSYALTASGTDSNYNLSFVFGGLDITAKAVTLNAPVITKTYDGGLLYSATSSDLDTLSSQLLAGDSVTAISLAYADKNAAIGNKVVNVSGAAIADGNSGNNYSVSYAGNSASTINKAAATVTANSSVLTYNAATQSVSGFTASGLAGGETSSVLTGVSTSGGSGRNVGSYALTASGTDNNYNLNFVPGGLDITAKAITLNAPVITKVYDGGLSYSATPSDLSALSSQLLSGDNVTAIALAYADKNAGIGNKLVNISGAAIADGNSGNNYSVSYAGNSASTINRASATVTANSSVLTYNAATQSVSGFTATGLVGGETAAVLTGVSTSGGSGRNVGSYALTANGTDNNYALSFVPGDLDITPKALTLNAPVIRKTYDGGTLYNANAADLENLSAQLLTGDSVTGITLAFANKNAGIGNKAVSANSAAINDGSGGGNYSVSYAVNTTSTINKANLLLTTSDVVKTYDGTTSAVGSLQSAGLAVGDTLTGAAFAFTNKNAGIGNKTVATSGVTVNDGNGGMNYAVSYANNTTSTINPASLTVGTGDVVKTYDGATAANGTLQSTGLVTGDTLAGGTFAFADKNAGTGKTVTTSGVTVNDGNNGNNYTVAYVNNTNSTINRAELAVTATGIDKNYDGTTAAAVTYAYNPIAGDVVLISGTASFVSKDVGANVSIGVSGLSASGADASNYNLNYTGAGVVAAAITPRMLEWMVDANGPRLSGFAVGESPLSLTSYANYAIGNPMPIIATAPAASAPTVAAPTIVAPVYPPFGGLLSLLNPFQCSVPSLDRMGGDPINAVADCTQQSGIGAARKRLDLTAADDDQ